MVFVVNMTYTARKMKTTTAFLVWANTTESFNHGLFLGETMNSEEISQTLHKHWTTMTHDEKVPWISKATSLTGNWIKPGCFKRCRNYYKWQDSGVIVAKCKYDDEWYIADENYQKGSLVQGEWPTHDGFDAPAFKVSLQVKWTDNGIQIGFKKDT